MGRVLVFTAVMWFAVALPARAMQAATPQQPAPAQPAPAATAQKPAPAQPAPAKPTAAPKPAPQNPAPAAATQKPAAPGQKPAAAPPAPAAQTQKPASAPPAPAAVPAAAPVSRPPNQTAANPFPVENYTYDPAGRRDPFLNLINQGSQPILSRRGDGLAGLSVNELSVRGVMQSRGAFIGMVQGPDGKTFMAKQGDKLLDGTVKAVNAEGLVIVQDVNDPLSLVKQREVSKKLRSLEAK